VPAIEALTVAEFSTVLLWGVAWIPFLVIIRPWYDDAQRDFRNVLGTITAFLTAGALVLPTRNSVWAQAIGVPFERIIKYHRWIGRVAIIIMTAHGGVQIVNRGWSVVLSSSSNGAYGYGNVYGLIAWFCFAVPFLFTDAIVRRSAFELFLYTHFLMIAGVIIAVLSLN
jgi:hypothetical protein